MRPNSSRFPSTDASAAGATAKRSRIGATSCSLGSSPAQNAKPGPLDHLTQRRRAHHEHLVPAASGRSQQWHQRIEVPRPTERASAKHPHLPRTV